MEQVYFSASMPGFILADWKDDGTYTDETWPKDAVQLTDDEVITFWKQTPPEGKQLGCIKGRPAWVDIPPPSKEQQIVMAEQKKEALLTTATTKIVVWQTKLLMGRKLTSAESAQLNDWMDYIDAVTAVDISTAPDIIWPEPPAS